MHSSFMLQHTVRMRNIMTSPFHGSTALVSLGLLIVEVSRSHSDTLHSVGLLWTSDQPVAGTST
jgi:hypothetical protein